MKDEKKPRKFLKLPEYPGGKKAFNIYVKQHLKYPEEALKAGVEGDVIITYEVDDNGDVLNPKVKHGIGYGCDQEALNLISGMKFAGARNRGVRVKSKFTTRIPFRLPVKEKSTGINYHITSRPDTPKIGNPAAGRLSYTWQIPLKTNDPEKET